jgi:hypothetical protein
MSQINFPDNPQIGDAVYIGSYKYIWSGSLWEKEVIDVNAIISSSVSSTASSIVGSAPENLDTLQELAAALGDDESFAATVTSDIAAKADKTYVDAQLALKGTVAYLSTTILTTDWAEETTGDWSGAFTATKTVVGITAIDRPVIDIDLSGSTFATYEALTDDFSLLFRVETIDVDQIKFYATSVPTNNLPINVKVMG